MIIRAFFRGLAFAVLCLSMWYYHLTGASATGFIALTGQTTFDWNYVWIGMLAFPLASGFITYVMLHTINHDRQFRISSWIMLSVTGGMTISNKAFEWMQDSWMNSDMVMIDFLGAAGASMLAGIFFHGLFDWWKKVEYSTG